MQRHGNVLAYYGETELMSHLYRCEFWHRDILFNHVEKFMMYGKAMLFNDQAKAQEILNTDNPYDCKQLGRQVAGFDQAQWDKWAYQIVLTGNREKYRQNPGAAKFLIETAPFILAEGSYDRTWGVGLSKDDTRIAVQANWTGENRAGTIQMQVRDELTSKPR
jgi:ribA/ribD-fused uncharacterized protein